MLSYMMGGGFILNYFKYPKFITLLRSKSSSKFYPNKFYSNSYLKSNFITGTKIKNYSKKDFISNNYINSFRNSLQNFIHTDKYNFNKINHTKIINHLGSNFTNSIANNKYIFSNISKITTDLSRLSKIYTIFNKTNSSYNRSYFSDFNNYHTFFSTINHSNYKKSITNSLTNLFLNSTNNPSTILTKNNLGIINSSKLSKTLSNIFNKKYSLHSSIRSINNYSSPSSNINQSNQNNHINQNNKNILFNHNLDSFFPKNINYLNSDFKNVSKSFSNQSFLTSLYLNYPYLQNFNDFKINDSNSISNLVTNNTNLKKSLNNSFNNNFNSNNYSDSSNSNHYTSENNINTSFNDLSYYYPSKSKSILDLDSIIKNPLVINKFLDLDFIYTQIKDMIFDELSFRCGDFL